MNERLLQFIWQFQYFNKNNLETTAGEALNILSVGNYNTNQGPDFLNGRVKVANEILAGNIELHVKSSDWKLHKHSQDERYRNIILHVVFDNDADLSLSMPTLELSNRIPKLMLDQYNALMHNKSFIPCSSSIDKVNDIILMAWKDALLSMRLEAKTEWIISLLNETNRHWEEVFWWMLARNFGMITNADAFFQISKSIPVRVLAKCRQPIHQLESLLLGQAGLLRGDVSDDYTLLLKKEYEYLRKKFALEPPLIQLNLLRMRPANFPTIRLAQLAMLIHQSQSLFTFIIEAKNLQSVMRKFEIQANDYWHYHYLPGEPSAFKIKYLGKQTIENIIINTIVPILFAYGTVQGDESVKTKAITWLEELPAEKNAITAGFYDLGVAIKNAFDSQALIYLKKNFCNLRNCLQCSIGNTILKRYDQAQV